MTFRPERSAPNLHLAAGGGGPVGAAATPRYFRTYEQQKAAMQALAQSAPELVKLEDFGDSFEKTAGKADR